jgi:hypothetical protein
MRRARPTDYALGWLIACTVFGCWLGLHWLRVAP